MQLAVCSFAIVAVMSATVAYAQDASLIDPCKAMPKAESAAARNFLTFEKFDKELRAALRKQDAVALSFLVKFPLRVNDAGGSISLNDAAALKTHFQDVFTPAVCKEILDEKNDHVGCNDKGIMYGPGTIWVNATVLGYAIDVVNRDAAPPYPANSWNGAKINYVCQTQTHRIVVDTVAGGMLRYRSWNKPRSVIDVPDLEITKGVGTFEGTGVCAYPVYTFKNGTAIYQVEGVLGCFGDSNGPPKDATGHLEVTVADKPVTDFWCY
jgi:hypothetical protein